jgi:NAD(P)-dependent dehydrogenase (short-subunit alcohol dehydrogenase family)
MLLQDKVAVIYGAGGAAQAAAVDALDEQAIDTHLQAVVDQAGRLDISFNAVGIPDTQILGVPLVELDLERFSAPIAAYTRSYFLTARLAARRMVANKSGVILTVTSIPSRTGTPLAGRLPAGDGRQGGPHPGPVGRAGPPGHSGGRAATKRAAGNGLAQGGPSRLAPRHWG